MLSPGDLATFPRELWVYQDAVITGSRGCWLSEPGGLVLVLAHRDRASGLVSVLDGHGRVGLVFSVDMEPV